LEYSAKVTLSFKFGGDPAPLHSELIKGEMLNDFRYGIAFMGLEGQEGI
jgi:hypothetical protein